jgi:hypothetical protein
LRGNDYFVSDTNDGRGADAIGDTTDIGHWWTWIRSPSLDGLPESLLTSRSYLIQAVRPA